jgi:DNA-binding transcriptional LysR family regulator
VDELQSIRAFIRVAETGSFAAAARSMHVSKSVITKRVNELEWRLKSQLLQRTTRRLTLNDAGNSYFERAIRIIADLEEAQTAVTSLTTGLTGVLRVSCIASFAAAQLCTDLRVFQQQHPGLTIEFTHNDRVYDAIQEGYDVCIQPSDILGDGIIRKQIVTIRRLLVATPAHLARYGCPALPGEISARKCAHNSFIQPATCISFSRDGAIELVPIQPVVLSNSIWMIREAILNGECIGVLPTYFIVDELRSGAVVPVLEAYEVSTVVMSAFYRRSKWVPAKVRLFLGFLAERYGDMPPWERRLAGL